MFAGLFTSTARVYRRKYFNKIAWLIQTIIANNVGDFRNEISSHIWEIAVLFIIGRVVKLT